MPEVGPDAFRLTRAALSDISGIWDYSARTWSVDQANAYIRGLHQTFEAISQNPYIARERTELNPPMRVHSYRSHIILYRILSDVVEITRVRHGREDWYRLTEKD